MHVHLVQPNQAPKHLHSNQLDRLRRRWWHLPKVVLKLLEDDSLERSSACRKASSEWWVLEVTSLDLVVHLNLTLDPVTALEVKELDGNWRTDAIDALAV